MDAAYRACTISYFGNDVPTCNVSNISQPRPGELLVKPFDPSALGALEQAGVELGWSSEVSKKGAITFTVAARQLLDGVHAGATVLPGADGRFRQAECREGHGLAGLPDECGQVWCMPCSTNVTPRLPE